MWICLNNAFLSIVSPEDVKDLDNLLVRARRPGDIERIFPGHDVETLNHRDYQFRALIPRAKVGSTIATHLTSITYRNFKGSTRDHKLHDAYNSVWGVMARLQPHRPYSQYGASVPRAMAASSTSAATASVPAKPTPAMIAWCQRMRNPAHCQIKRSRSGTMSASGIMANGAPTYIMADRMVKAGLIKFEPELGGYEVAKLTEAGEKVAAA